MTLKLTSTQRNKLLILNTYLNNIKASDCLILSDTDTTQLWTITKIETQKRAIKLIGTNSFGKTATDHIDGAELSKLYNELKRQDEDFKTYLNTSKVNN